MMDLADATRERIIGTAVDYDGLITALRARKDELQLTDALIDELANLARGHTGKLLGGTHVRSFGPVSLGAMLATLAVKITLVVDEAAQAQMAPYWERRAFPQAVHASKEARIGKMQMQRVFRPAVRELMKQARAARNQKLEPVERQRIARLAARARWHPEARSG